MTSSTSVTIPADAVFPADNKTKSSFSSSKTICSIIIAVIVVITIVITWAILRPLKPIFNLENTTLYAFNLTDDSNRLLTTSLQATLSTRNPNRRLGIDYVTLGTYVSYRGQPITLPVELPQGYLASKESVEWSPVLSGESVPLSPELAATLGQDLNAGVLLLELKVYGQLRWKVGTVVVTWCKHRLNVNCPASLMASSGIGGMVNGSRGIGGMVNGRGRVWPANQGCYVEV